MLVPEEPSSGVSRGPTSITGEGGESGCGRFGKSEGESGGGEGSAGERAGAVATSNTEGGGSAGGAVTLLGEKTAQEPSSRVASESKLNAFAAMQPSNGKTHGPAKVWSEA